MEDIKIKELKENVVKVFNTKSQVVQYIRRYDFDQANTLIITKVKDNYIVKKVWEEDEDEDEQDN